MPRTVEQLIDDQIHKLQQLKAMTADPHMLDLMRQIVSPVNGANGTTAHQPESQEPLFAAPVVATKKARKSAFSPNGLTDAVTAFVDAAVGDFTLQDIVAKLKADGFRFVSKTPRIAVNAVIQRLIKLGRVSIIGKGDSSLGSPNILRKVK